MSKKNSKKIPSCANVLSQTTIARMSRATDVSSGITQSYMPAGSSNDHGRLRELVQDITTNTPIDPILKHHLFASALFGLPMMIYYHIVG